MGATDNGIQVNNTHISVTTGGILGLDDPQPCQLIGLVTDLRIPVHKGTRVVRVGK